MRGSRDEAAAMRLQVGDRTRLLDQARASTGVPSSAEVPRFFSVAQVAAMFGMSSVTLYRAISEGAFPAVRIRGRLIVPARAIEAMSEAAVAEQTVVDAASFVPGAVTLP